MHISYLPLHPIHPCSDQLRQRLVRMSVRHHEQLFSYQQREFQLTQSLKECSMALEESINVMKRHRPNTPSTSTTSSNGHNSDLSSVLVIPQPLVDASMKFAMMTSSIAPPEGGFGGGGAATTGGAGYH